MTRQNYARLQNELVALRSRWCRMEVPDDFMDYDANLNARHSARQTRIREIEAQLANAVVDGDPVGDPVARAGMVLTIRYDSTGQTETFLLGRRGTDSANITAYSMASPLGRAIAGARPGDQRIYSIPDEKGMLITLLQAVPYEMHVPKNPGPQAAYRDATVTRVHQRP
jgi:transcription elongation GreA/GreB family factor